MTPDEEDDGEHEPPRSGSVDPPTGPFYTPAAHRPAPRPSGAAGPEQRITPTSVTRSATALIVALAVLANPLSAQGPDDGDGVRFGVSFGGISTVAVAVELFRDSRSIELALGTWSFRDLSVSATARQYFGASALKPVVGAGLWLAAAAPAADGERTGLALVVRAPIGVDWAMADRHAAGLIMNVNRGLWVKRSDPEDELPMNRRLVPLPELYYRFTR